MQEPQAPEKRGKGRPKDPNKVKKDPDAPKRPIGRPKIIITDPERIKNIASKKARADKRAANLERFSTNTEEELLEFVAPHRERTTPTARLLSEEQADARLILMERLLARRVPPEMIRKMLNISVSVYYDLVKNLRDRLRFDPHKLDIPLEIGTQFATLKDITAEMLRRASGKEKVIEEDEMGNKIEVERTLKGSEVRAYYNMAMQAMDKQNALLTKCGVFSPDVTEMIVQNLLINMGGNAMMTMHMRQNEQTLDAHDVNLELAARLRQFSLAKSNDVSGVVSEQ